MAEALAAVYGISAIASLTGQFVDLSTRLNYYIKHIKHARAEIEEVDLEVSQFTIALKLFQKCVDGPSAKNIPFIQEAIQAELPSILLRHSKIVLGGADRMLRSLKPLRNDTASSAAAKLLARLSWAFKKDEVQPMKSSLISIKSSLALFCAMSLVSKMVNEIQLRKQNGYEVSELRKELQILKRDVRCWRKRCKRAEQKQESRQSYSSPAIPPMSELSHVVEDLVKREQSRQRKERRELGSDLSSSPNTSPITSTLSSNTNTVEFPPPLNPNRRRSRSVVLDSSAVPLSPILPSTDREGGPRASTPRERGWTPTALCANKPEPRIARSRSVRDIVVDDGFNPVHVVRRVPRTKPGTGSDEE